MIIPKHAHVWQVHPVKNLTCDNHDPSPQTVVLPPSPQPNNLMLDYHDGLFSNTVTVNPDNLLSSTCTKRIIDINKAYDKVFSTEVPMYNGRSGNILGVVNMGPTNPSKKRATSTLPTWQISRTAAKVWQFRVFGYTGKAWAIPVHVEYLNLTFLVQKPNGGSRMVTDFGEVGKYSNPQTSLLPTLNLYYGPFLNGFSL